MNEQKIKWEKAKTHFLRLYEYTYEELNMNFIEQAIYAISVTYHYINMTLEQLCVKGGISSEKTMQKYLSGMVKKGFLEKRIVKITGTKKRTLYTHRIDEYGTRPEEAIKADLDLAEQKLKEYYLSTTPIGAYYMRKAKKNK